MRKYLPELLIFSLMHWYSILASSWYQYSVFGRETRHSWSYASNFPDMYCQRYPCGLRTSLVCWCVYMLLHACVYNKRKLKIVINFQTHKSLMQKRTYFLRGYHLPLFAALLQQSFVLQLIPTRTPQSGHGYYLMMAQSCVWIMLKSRRAFTVSSMHE